MFKTISLKIFWLVILTSCLFSAFALVIIFNPTNLLSQINQPILLMSVPASLFIIMAIVAKINVNRWITKPVKQITHWAATVNKGKFNTKTPQPKTPEMRLLSEHINQMAETLKTLKTQSQVMSTVMSTIDNIYIETDVDLRILSINLAALKILKYQEAEIKEKSFEQFVTDIDLVKAKKSIHSPHPCKPFSLCISTKEGQSIPMSMTGFAVMNEARQIERLVFVGQDITLINKAKDDLIFDTLTQLPNRKAFEANLRRETAKATRHESLTSVLIVGLDNFKTINETYGHQVGDIILQETTNRLKHTLREGDYIARIGSDEFGIVLTDTSTCHDAGRVAKKLISSINKGFIIHEYEIHVGSTIGISTLPEDGKTFDTLLKHADIALGIAKERSKGNYYYFTAAMGAAHKKRLFLENNIYKALKRNEFTLEYQPQYKLPNEIITGVEALLRWHHPNVGNIPPNIFLPAAEQTGMIIPIGEWVLRTACKQYMDWKKNANAPDTLQLLINVSYYQLAKGHYDEIIKKVLDETLMPAENLTLELTETAVIRQLNNNDASLKAITDLGVNIVIDDFGAGYNSLKRFQNLSINTLKLDKAFISDVNTNEHNAAITESIFDLTKQLNIEVVSEGVETEEQLKYLIENGCQLMQGYYFGKPVDSNKITNMLATTNYIEKKY